MIKIMTISRPLRPVSHVVQDFARAHRGTIITVQWAMIITQLSTKGILLLGLIIDHC